jgi:hypothetical protein
MTRSSFEQVLNETMSDSAISHVLKGLLVVACLISCISIWNDKKHEYICQVREGGSS